MRYKSKKQRNGRTVVVFDSEGQNIASILDALSDKGWVFDKIKVTYKTKTGDKKSKEIPESKVSAVLDRYGFSRWSFDAHNGRAVLGCSIDNDTSTLIVTTARNHALDAIRSLPPLEDASDDDDVFDDLDDEDDTEQKAPRRGNHNRREHNRDDYYDDYGDDDYDNEYDDYDNRASQYNDRQYDRYDERYDYRRPETARAIRETGRAHDASAIQSASMKKHTSYFFIAILELLFGFVLAPIGFVIGALTDTVKARKLARTDPMEAEKRFKEARNLLIFGAIAAALMFTVVVWRYGAYIMPAVKGIIG